ncbi:hypothetical protein KEM52_005903 [Ascosphaera acerosa]|nr:hypothetical protein KEM52_005903 [Ascosphaera acerosa]
MAANPSAYTYVVEHLDPELGPWSALEYGSIARESGAANATFLLSSVPPSLELPPELAALTQDAEGNGSGAMRVEHRSIETICADRKERVCLLDPAAKTELSPQDGDVFDVFLFGGILDRTGELREKGFANRRLGPVQMTTDTAVRVTRMVVQDKIPLDKVPHVDYPELRINQHESTEMPFRYVKDSQGKPIMPEGMVELIMADADKSVDDLL